VLRLLEIDEHGRRLRDLLSRFRAQELAISSALDHLAAAAAAAQEDAWHAAFASDGAHDRRVARCIELQAEIDRLEVELVHVRMAIHGTQEELEAHDHRRFTAARSLAIASPA
jgi:hypothetical protein